MKNKLGVCEWSLPLSGPTAVVLAGKAGFQGIQLGDLGGRAMNFPLNSPVIQEEYLKACKEYNVEIQALHPGTLQREGTMMAPLDSPKGQQGAHDVEMNILACEQLGCHNIMLSSFFATLLRNEWDFQTFAAQIKRACKFAADHDVIVTYESVLIPERIERFINTVGEDNLKLCYDTVNPLRYGSGVPVEEVPKLLKYIDHFHVKDMPSTMKEYAMIGEGTGQFKEFADYIKKTDFDGWFVSENYYSTLSLEQGRDSIDVMKDDIANIKRLLG